MSSRIHHPDDFPSNADGAARLHQSVSTLIYGETGPFEIESIADSIEKRPGMPGPGRRVATTGPQQ